MCPWAACLSTSSPFVQPTREGLRKMIQETAIQSEREALAEDHNTTTAFHSCSVKIFVPSLDRSIMFL